MSKLLGEQIEVSGSEHGVASSYFEVHGRLRMGPTVQERSLVRRMGLEATTVWRERTGARVPGMS
jgi:general secretion pathway protein K